MISIIIIFVVFIFVVSKLKNASKYSQFPSGPISLPIFGSMLSLGTKPHEKLMQLKSKYGNVIAIDFGINRGIVLNDFNTIKEAFSHKAFQIRPDMEASDIIRGKNLCGIVLSSGKTNEEQRAFVLKVLKNFGMGKKSIENLVVEEMEKLLETFDKQLGTPIVNKELFEVTAVSALWSIMTGEHGKTEDYEFNDMLHQVRLQGLNFNIITLFFPTLCKLFPKKSGWHDLTTAGVAIYNYVGKTIQDHKKIFKPNEQPKDLIDAYLQKMEDTTDEKSTFFGKAGDENLRGVLADFLVAGTDTINACLTWYLTVALYYPEIQEKIQKEIDRVMGRVRVPCLADRLELPYIEAVIFEILRYSALLPLGLPHATSEDVKLEEYVIPKGTVVIPNSYAALHDPKRWEEPETFKPERFLNEDGTGIERNLARDVDLVFGHGKRICPGAALAKDELFLFICGLSQRYTFQRDPQCKYGETIETELGVSLIPFPYSLIINKR